ncbi:MAG: hypothetical protein WCK02_17120 [Bacteroidota bacterium]
MINIGKFLIYISIISTVKLTVGQNIEPRFIQSIVNLEKINKTDTLFFYKNKIEINSNKFDIIRDEFNNCKIGIDSSFFPFNNFNKIVKWKEYLFFSGNEKLFIINPLQHGISVYNINLGYEIAGKTKEGVWISSSVAMAYDSLNGQKKYPCSILLFDGVKLNLKETRMQGKLVHVKNFKTCIYKKRCIFVSDNFQIYQKISMENGEDDSIMFVYNGRKKVDLVFNGLYSNEFNEFNKNLYCFNKEVNTLFKFEDLKSLLSG